MRFPLRLKFFFFATLLAVLPLALVSQILSALARDELKSAANEDLTLVAAELRAQFDNTFEGRWLTPLLVIRNGIDSSELGIPQKVSLMTLGLQDMPDVVALQLSIDGSDLPILVTQEAFAERLANAGLDPVEALTTPADFITAIEHTRQMGRPIVNHLPETGDWMATLALPLTARIAGRPVTLSAKINLSSLGDLVQNHPFAQRGEITVVDQAGRRVLDRDTALLDARAIVADAMPLIMAGARADALLPYERPDGTRMLGAYAFPAWFHWAVITELSEDNAYAVVNAIMRQILIIGLVGFVIASAGALIFARSLTGLILQIGQVVERVGQGDFAARVERIRTRDEIGELAQRINQMIAHLSERLELMKFVSRGTMSAIRQADTEGMERGGERRHVSVIFTDIRGYTAFSERVAPEVVIDVLNQYFEVQTSIVERLSGDVDKFVGDALVAVFEGDRHEERAVTCGVEITKALAKLLERHPEHNLQVGVGVASGEVVMGAMGARQRMDFTVLGSTVNLAARLCSKADPDQVLVDEASRKASHASTLVFEALHPLQLKGYTQPVPVFSADVM